MNSETLSDVNPGRMFIMTDKAGPDEPTFKKMQKDPVWKNLTLLK